MLTYERLIECISYDPETGKFTWRTKTRGHVIGMVAGGMCGSGYVQIKIDGIAYRAHRLAWMYVNGSFPSGMIDHINRIKTDNRISNLRETDMSGNQRNILVANSKSTSGLRGVRKHPDGWTAAIRIGGKQKYLGFFKDKESAHLVYMRAKEKYHGISC